MRSTDTDVARKQALVTRMACDALTAAPPDEAARAPKVVTPWFGGDQLVTEVPGSEASPGAFQVVARDDQVGWR